MTFLHTLHSKPDGYSSVCPECRMAYYRDCRFTDVVSSVACIINAKNQRTQMWCYVTLAGKASTVLLLWLKLSGPVLL